MATQRKPRPKAKAKEVKMTSMRIDVALVERLQTRAKSLGIGWQTLLKMIVARYADADL